MILTDKAKSDFIDYIDSDDLLVDGMSEVYRNALIIEWFDSLRTLNKKRGVYNFKQLYLSSFKEMANHYSISEIQKRIIIKANEIYNGR